MKVLVFSDSHHKIEQMLHLIEKENPDRIIHLGDCFDDALEMKRAFPEIVIDMVPGNCDCVQEPLQKLLLIEDKKILICHGHQYQVKSGYLSIEYAAMEKDADAVLFGHTHRVFYEERNGLLIFNPGSIGKGMDEILPSYGVLNIEFGKPIQYSVIFLENQT